MKQSNKVVVSARYIKKANELVAKCRQLEERVADADQTIKEMAFGNQFDACIMAENYLDKWRVE